MNLKARLSVSSPKLVAVTLAVITSVGQASYGLTDSFDKPIWLDDGGGTFVVNKPDKPPNSTV
jgi:hypothetical protein